MNALVLGQTGGYPLTQERLAELQTAFSVMQGFGALVGSTAIISGCTVNGSQTTSGVVYYNNEVFNFIGGGTQTDVVIVEETTERAFQDGNTKPVHKNRYITFGSGTGSIPWANFKRTLTLEQLSSRILPPGTNPQLYCGAIANIPTGWQLCDGTNGTPDLRSRFIVGYDATNLDYNVIGKTGGAKEVTLTMAQMPAHSHSGTTNSSGAHTHGLSAIKVNANNTYAAGLYDRSLGASSAGLSTDSAGSHAHTFTTDIKGSGTAHENRPPYYTLAYIIYTGN